MESNRLGGFCEWGGKHKGRKRFCSGEGAEHPRLRTWTGLGKIPEDGSLNSMEDSPQDRANMNSVSRHGATHDENNIEYPTYGVACGRNDATDGNGFVARDREMGPGQAEPT